MGALFPVHAFSMTKSRDTKTDSSSLKLFLCGDVMTGRGIDQILPHPSEPRLYELYVTDARDYVELAERVNGKVKAPVDFAYIWGDALEELQKQMPISRIINLETAVTTNNYHWPKGINYRMNPANVSCLTEASIDCCVLANNHVLDWDYEGLEETLATLRAAGITTCGAGKDKMEARAPAILNVASGRRVIVFSFGLTSSGITRDWAANVGRAGVNLLPDLSEATVRNIADQVMSIKRSGDIVLASLHWGANWGYEIEKDQRRFAYALIDSARVDVVHGHSSHHVKGIEVYKHRPIIYGCGDFLNDYEGIDGHEAYHDELGLMYFPVMDVNSGRLQSFTMTPTRIKNLRVNRASLQESRWLVDMLNREGKNLGTRVTLNDENRLELHWSKM